LMPIRSSPTTESSSIRSAGGSTRRGMHMGLRTLATVTASVATVTVVSATLVTSDRDTDRDTPLVVALLGRSDTRTALVEAVSADLAVRELSVAAVADSAEAALAVEEASVAAVADSVVADSMAAGQAVSMEAEEEDTAVDGSAARSSSLDWTIS
jgi:hypothetical protein